VLADEEFVAARQKLLAVNHTGRLDAGESHPHRDEDISDLTGEIFT